MNDKENIECIICFENCNGENECFDCGGKPNGGAFINACGDCECGIDGQIIDNVLDGCTMPEMSLSVTSDGKVLFNSGNIEFSGVQFNIDGVILSNEGGTAGYYDNWFIGTAINECIIEEIIEFGDDSR